MPSSTSWAASDDVLLVGEPTCDVFVDFLGVTLRDPLYRRAMQRFLQGHTQPVAVKPSKHKKHKWR